MEPSCEVWTAEAFKEAEAFKSDAAADSVLLFCGECVVETMFFFAGEGIF